MAKWQTQMPMSWSLQQLLFGKSLAYSTLGRIFGKMWNIPVLFSFGGIFRHFCQPKYSASVEEEKCLFGLTLNQPLTQLNMVKLIIESIFQNFSVVET